MTIGVRPVHPSIGAEILNVDTSSRLSQQTIDQIHTAIDKHAVESGIDLWATSHLAG